MNLPLFKYHPDPVSTGSIIKSDAVCECCGQSRGYIYTGPVYAEDEIDYICPWCIADGRAHQELEASFTDEDGIGGGGSWCAVTSEIIEEVAYRTPGFSGWQQEQWWTHCDDAAQFLGRAGKEELLVLGTDAVLAIQDSTGLPDGTEWDRFLNALDKDGSPTAYIFRCQKCGALGGYQDCD
ncbi:CbrC family protein [Deefgea piscis]|uniref:CbrC family protein n=1 Tax=Deefgea piscis TaxID=2739061 RepID=UPI001C809C7D|nr:CbrC family protein [Deefgea piscis]QZA81949.1 CbrC family protein [Deefgea piscis]